jgi:hypothetical protein
LVTDRSGTVVAAMGIGPEQTRASIGHVSGRERPHTVSPNERVAVQPP